MTDLNNHDTQEALDYLDQQIAAAERDNYQFAYQRGYAAAMAGKEREAMYGYECIDNAWLDGWDAASAQLGDDHA